MGIKFRCHACDKKLHVKAFLAGKRGVCPKCGAKVRIPSASTEGTHEAAVSGREAEQAVTRAASARPAAGQQVGTSAAGSPQPERAGSVAAGAAGSETRSSPARDPISEMPDAVWYVRPPTGGQFGPANGAVMRRWLNEGRVSADALVWREGWPDWQAAGPVFPALEGADLVGPVAATPVPVHAEPETFNFVQPRAAAVRDVRPRAKADRRHVAIIGALVVVCVALAVAFVVVLRR